MFIQKGCDWIRFGSVAPCEMFYVRNCVSKYHIILQCLKAVNTANRVLVMIRRSICVRDKTVILQLYKSQVRPHLKCRRIPHFQKDIDLLEGVQRRATKLIPDLKDKSYEDRLRCLNLSTLESRRIRGDLVEVFKIFKGLDN